MFFCLVCFFFFQAEDGIRDIGVTGVQTCALPISVILSPIPGLDIPLGGTVSVPPTSSLLHLTGATLVAEEGTVFNAFAGRSEERRVGKECRSRWSPYH